MFNIQDPSFCGNKLLHEALLEACNTALYGGGAYAFVTSSGVNMLMRDEMFEKFIDRGNFHLVIGMDDITNIKTLETLMIVQGKSKNHLQLSAYISADNSSTFHPKFSWFRTENGGIIVVGSGNLTANGLRRNVEAFSFQEVSIEKIIEIERIWDVWLRDSKPLLKNIADKAVLEKAAENAAYKRKQHTPERLKREKRRKELGLVIPVVEQDEIDEWSFNRSCQILIAEIGRGRGGWSQASFDRKTFVEYFGVQFGTDNTYRLVMRDIRHDGSLGEPKSRKAIIKEVSVNYSIELSNPEGILYPSQGRPIGVFVRIAERTFMYIIVFPDQSGYDNLLELVSIHRERADRLVRYPTTVTELQATVPTLPLLYYLM